MLCKVPTNMQASLRALVALIVLSHGASALSDDTDAPDGKPADNACVAAEIRVDELLDQVYQARGQCELGKAMQELYTRAHDELKRHCQGKPGLGDTLKNYKEQAKTGKTMARMGC